MKLKKLTIVAILVMLTCCIGLNAYAETATDIEPENTPAYYVTIRYSEDSSTVEGISYEVYVDPATFAIGFKIANDLPFGHVIYDDPTTAYIDGIRVNGATVNSLTVIPEQGTNYDIIVKTVYEDNLLGDIAKIIDGKFDFKILLENPTLLLMSLYYILAILSIVGCTISALHSKKKKIKTSDEIAAKVTESSDRAVEKVKTEVTETVLAETTPILQRIFDGIQNVVTAITLSTSKSSSAPIAMLDTLQKATDASNVTALIDDIRKTVTESVAKTEEIRAANVETLKEIAAALEPAEPAPTTDEPANTVTKSVF